MTPEQLIEAAREANRRAKEHKRLSSVHRRRARVAARELDRYRRQLAAFGIELVIGAEEGTHHGRTADPSLT